MPLRYYFKRGGHRPNVRASQPPASSLSLSERSMSFSQLLPSPPPPTPASLQEEEEEEEEVSLSAQRKPNKKRRLITPESDSESENFSRTAKPQNATTTKCLEGKRFYLHLVGSDYDSLCTVIKRFVRHERCLIFFRLTSIHQQAWWSSCSPI